MFLLLIQLKTELGPQSASVNFTQSFIFLHFVFFKGLLSNTLTFPPHRAIILPSLKARTTPIGLLSPCSMDTLRKFKCQYSSRMPVADQEWQDEIFMSARQKEIAYTFGVSKKREYDCTTQAICPVIICMPSYPPCLPPLSP